MSDTLLSMRTKVRRRLDESTARFWTDADLNEWINEGAREVARRAETLQATTNISSVADTQQYSLPSNVFRVHRVEFTRDPSRSTALEYRDFNTMDSIWWGSHYMSPGDPYWYTMWGFPPTLAMIVYPTPPDSIADAFKVYYYRMPATASADGDSVEIPSGWDDIILDYCEYSAFRKDADPRWSDAKALFEAKMQNMVDTTRRWTDQAGSYDTGIGPLPRWIWDDGIGW